MNKKMKMVLAVTIMTTLIASNNFYTEHNSTLKESTYKSFDTDLNELDGIKLDENKDMEDFIGLPEPESTVSQVSEPTITDKPTVENSSKIIASRGTSVNKGNPTTSSKPATSTKPSSTKSTPTQTPKPSVPTSTNITSNISKEERALFARLVSAEAAGESFEGKLAVATVIMNRVKSGLFSNTITGVIYGKDGGYYQFSPVLDGRINEPATADSTKAVDMVLTGHRSFGPKVMWFLNPKQAISTWITANKSFFKSIGNHDFYY